MYQRTILEAAKSKQSTMLYTRKGDGGTSGLFGSKERLPKNSPVFHALGTLDELNSFLGLCRAQTANFTSPVDLPEDIKQVQEHLFIIQAELAGAEKEISQKHVDILEKIIERVEAHIENPHAFVIPGANEISALFDITRAVSRRAERTVIEAADKDSDFPAETKAYLNRISSLLYACARYTASFPGSHESSPTYE